MEICKNLNKLLLTIIEQDAKLNLMKKQLENRKLGEKINKNNQNEEPLRKVMIKKQQIENKQQHEKKVIIKKRNNIRQIRHSFRSSRSSSSLLSSSLSSKRTTTTKTTKTTKTTRKSICNLFEKNINIIKKLVFYF